MESGPEVLNRKNSHRMVVGRISRIFGPLPYSHPQPWNTEGFPNGFFVVLDLLKEPEKITNEGRSKLLILLKKDVIGF